MLFSLFRHFEFIFAFTFFVDNFKVYYTAALKFVNLKVYYRAVLKFVNILVPILSHNFYYDYKQF